MKLIIDISDKDYEKLKDGHIPFSILDVMQNGTPIPDNATNEDVIDTMFKDDDRFYLNTDKNGFIHFRGVKKDWLDEPYQKGGK